MLSDRDIHAVLNLPDGNEGKLIVENMAEHAIKPASIDLMLSNHFHFFKGFYDFPHPIDPKKDNSTDGLPITVPDDDFFLLGAGDFALASTRERFHFPAHLGGRLEGKSSVGRLGLIVHVTAGFFDPGFVGYPTLELFNCRRRPIKLYPGMPIAQMGIFALSSPAEIGYGGHASSKYVDQGPAPAPSQYHRNFHG